MALKAGQFAVYQLKETPENREIRFQPYEELQKRGIRLQYESYRQAYQGMLRAGDTPDAIRARLQKIKPLNFDGHALSIGDIIVINDSKGPSAYYVESEGFTELPGFFRGAPSGTAVSMETDDYRVEGKEGKWLARDYISIEGKNFFLMEHKTYGTEAANVILDENGKLVADNVRHGFDKEACIQIREYLKPSSAVPLKPEMDGKWTRAGRQRLAAWQKYFENGEYLRSAEMSEEQNYNMIDGRVNNLPAKPREIGGRISVLDRLHLKQAQIARRTGKPVQQLTAFPEMERRKTD